MGFYSLVVKHVFRSFCLWKKNGTSSKGWKLCFCSLLVKYHQFLWRRSSYPYEFPILIGSTTFNQGFIFLLEGLHVVVSNKVKFYPLKYTIPQNKHRLTLPNSELKDYLALEHYFFSWSMWILERELWHNDESAYNHRILGFPIINGKTKTANSTETNQTKLLIFLKSSLIWSFLCAFSLRLFGPPWHGISTCVCWSGRWDPGTISICFMMSLRISLHPQNWGRWFFKHDWIMNSLFHKDMGCHTFQAHWRTHSILFQDGHITHQKTR